MSAEREHVYELWRGSTAEKKAPINEESALTVGKRV
jgi:hypothetical protein